MAITRHAATLSVVVGVSLSIGCAEMPADQDDPDLSETNQDYVGATNGLRVVNGLQTVNGVKAINGLRTLNGLTTSNGLRSVNGLTTINGLRTANGLATINGLRTVRGITKVATLNVDCTGRTLASEGGTCTGEPDGLLSRTTGLMSSDEGIETAKYLVRCALPAGRTLTIKDYTGALVSLAGGIGLVPHWETRQCGAACEERVSACLIALTNGKGEHIEVEFTAPMSQIGTDHSMVDGEIAYPYQESVTFGNLFLDPPQAYIAGGVSYPNDFAFQRSCYLETGPYCSTYTIMDEVYEFCGEARFSRCPYEHAGTIKNTAPTDGFTSTGYNFSGETAKCAQSDTFDPGDGNGPRGTAVACSAPGSTVQSWKHPLTVWRNVPAL